MEVVFAWLRYYYIAMKHDEQVCQGERNGEKGGTTGKKQHQLQKCDMPVILFGLLSWI